jgi:hypothetical protein
LRELLHVDRALAQEVPPRTGDDRVVRDHAQVIRHLRILADQRA